MNEHNDLCKINFFGKPFIVSANRAINDAVFKARPDTFRRFAKIDEVIREMES